MKVLFIDEVHSILEERLAAAGFQCQKDYTSAYEQLVTKFVDYQGIVIRSRIPLDEHILRENSHLKFIARSGSGLENINLEVAEELDIAVINSPEGNMDAVAEHSIGMLLMLLNKLKSGDKEVREGKWNRESHRGLELKSRTVGIIGFGRMGSAFAKRLRGFDCKIMAHDKYKQDFGNEYVEEVSLDELKRSADVISIHLPLTNETKHYIDQTFIESVDQPFILINTARGNNVSLDALNQGLAKGKIEGACLDVLEYEKASFENIEMKQSSLWENLSSSDKVIFSPHVAGWTEESYVKLSSVLADKILQQFTP